MNKWQCEISKLIIQVANNTDRLIMPHPSLAKTFSVIEAETCIAYNMLLYVLFMMRDWNKSIGDIVEWW